MSWSSSELSVQTMLFAAGCSGSGNVPCAHRKVCRTPDMELGHWVTGSPGHLGHLSRPGHRVIILTRCDTRLFPVFEKMLTMQIVHSKC